MDNARDLIKEYEDAADPNRALATPPLPPVTPEQPRTTRKERGLPRKRGQQSAGQQSTGQQSAKTLPIVPPPPKRPRGRPRKVRTPPTMGGDTVPE